MAEKIVWIAGANGLIGSHLCKQLCALESISEVYAFVRSTKNQDFHHAKLRYVDTDWENLFSEPKNFPAPSDKVDALFCALGSTKKKTPGRAAYRRIDVDYPIAFGQLGLEHGARYYGLVSAHGASTRSPSFYLNMKADVEAGLNKLGFQHLAFARPSLLLGERDEFRILEKASEFVCKLLPGDLKAISADDVATALINAYASHGTGTSILNSGSMQGLCKGRA